jgi:hypothetical protein
MAARIKSGRNLRSWVGWYLEGRRRMRAAAHAVASPPPIPAMPTGLSAEDTGGGFRLSWNMSGVDFEDGCAVEVRDIDNGIPFTEYGRTGPDVNFMDVDGGGSSDFECRVRSFNVSGYSPYSDVLPVNLI